MRPPAGYFVVSPAALTLPQQGLAYSESRGVHLTLPGRPPVTPRSIAASLTSAFGSHGGGPRADTLLVPAWSGPAPPPPPPRPECVPVRGGPPHIQCDRSPPCIRWSYYMNDPRMCARNKNDWDWPTMEVRV